MLAGDPAFDDGVRLYRALEYEQAIFRFQEVAVRPGLPGDDKAEAFTWLGLAYAGTGDLEAARRMFMDALRADPATKLPAEVSPRVVSLFEEVKGAIKAEATATRPPPDGEPDKLPPDGGGAPPSPREGKARDLLIPLATTGAGVVLLIGGGALAAAAADHWKTASNPDPDAFQDDVKAALDAMNIEVAAAAFVLPVGAFLAGLGAFLLMSDAPAAPATEGAE